MSNIIEKEALIRVRASFCFVLCTNPISNDSLVVLKRRVVSALH